MVQPKVIYLAYNKPAQGNRAYDYGRSSSAPPMQQYQIQYQQDPIPAPVVPVVPVVPVPVVSQPQQSLVPSQTQPVAPVVAYAAQAPRYTGQDLARYYVGGSSSMFPPYFNELAKLDRIARKHAIETSPGSAIWRSQIGVIIAHSKAVLSSARSEYEQLGINPVHITNTEATQMQEKEGKGCSSKH